MNGDIDLSFSCRLSSNECAISFLLSWIVDKMLFFHYIITERRLDGLLIPEKEIAKM
jgi:hypothetical protein